ncbi:ras GTPase-activating-like protein IQGAP1 [Diachasma alloeum]|uniref:ras GTPase-activating-like protein IQGAP1 n=1 Tax=Diachasma alloeum TaxID=454923 RepID=UPI00073815E0|nr:ras GTPase-activating-like protein IQGAP1 [Diachasma alloeum]
MTGIAGESTISKNDADVRKSAEEMDEQRQKTMAYEYLCHLEEAKKWMEACLKEELPPTTELEENLRNGVYLAKLAHFMEPGKLPLSKIYDIEQRRYSIAGLQFRHTDNINHFLMCLKSMQLPLTFQPETTDIYDKKNMPRVIYCIHALSTHLFKLGRAPQIQDLYGKINFTDAEIDTVSAELKKYGIQMPAFQKIGGLLTNSMAGDTAALHAAVIAINQALTSSNKKSMLTGLQNPSARLRNVNPAHMNDYYEALQTAKDSKTQAALNRSFNDSYIPDAYDELLTPAEIQGHLNNVNARLAFQSVMNSLDSPDETLIKHLKSPALELQEILPENVDRYREVLFPVINQINPSEDTEATSRHWQELLQSKISEANEMERKLAKREALLLALNRALEEDDMNACYLTLLSPDLGLGDQVDRFALRLYFEEMKIDHLESQTNISYDDLLNSLNVLNAVAAVTKAVDTGNPDLVFEALSNPEAHVDDLDEAHKVKYYRALAALRSDHKNDIEDCPLLAYVDIQDCVDLVNLRCRNANEAINILRDLNLAVSTNNRSGVMEALTNPSLKLKTPISRVDASLYLVLFKRCLNENHRDGSELWLDDIENVAQAVAAEAQQVQHACHVLWEINKNLKLNDFNGTIASLEKTGLKVSEQYKQRYFQALKALRGYKESQYKCPFVRYVTPTKIESFLDLEKFNYTWDKPKTISESHFVTKEDIEDIIRTITVEEYNIPSGRFNEKLIIHLQALIRGYLVRQRIANRLEYFHDNVQKIVKIQAWWRGVLHRRSYRKKLVERIRDARGRLKRQRDRNDYYRQHEDKIVKIQAFWRGRSARRAFLSLLRMEKPPFPVVRHFSAILNFNAEDYDKDLQLQQLKNDVVQTIRYNQNLSQQLDSMDIKIGLLIQNRITLQDVIAHGKSLETLAKEKHQHRSRKNSISENLSSHKGLKSLTKEGRKMLEGYQHLFYALQTNPEYLSKLLFLIPQSKTNKFLQNVILTLYNFGSNIREEYLLLKLFGRALQEEIRSKFQKPSEVVTGNPLVLKMVVHYARQLNGRALRQILGPVIERVLSDRSVNIETNPVDIYKSWRNQLEMEKGETLDLPYSVNHQQALNNDQVRQRLHRGIETLKDMVMEFLNRITESRDIIPYGMLYMSKVLYDTLAEKFPQAPEKDILKVVGNLIYYHYINAAIVAPDAFDIVTLPVDRSLSNDQRRNLASIAKILQFAASKKGFGDEATHLMCLNPFIIDCHERFKKFFRSCCQIPALDEHFSIHEYTEATLIHKPEIYISVQEICDTHSLVLEYQYEIAPDPMDPLHELLDDLEAAPTVASLMGITEPVCEATLTRMGKTEVCLVLTNRFEVPDTDDQSLQKLFIKTKELLVSVLQFLKGDTLVAALEAPCPSPVQEKLYDAKYSSISPSTNMNMGKGSSSLNDCRHQLRAYLLKLEQGGWVSRADGYQSIVTAVAKDLCNKGKYRAMRNRELQTLRLTRQRLQEKTKYYAEQVEYYNEYTQRCLENLHTGRGSMRAVKVTQKSNHGKLRSKATLKYSAAKLAEKGVLLEIVGLSQSQFKNVIFEITPTEQNGIFTIKGKFMGVEMEKIEIDIQNLLELQFEGAPIMDMFGKAKINVNLLLYLLNRKFYGKT